jgi:hypothetical protein
MNMPPAEDTLIVDHELLTRVARVAEPHHHTLLEAIRAEFGDEQAATLHTVALSMLLGTVLKAVPHAHRAPDGIALVWSLMGVPFGLDVKRVQ